MRLELLTTTKTSVLVLRVVTPHGLAGIYRRFGETYCLHLQGWIWLKGWVWYLLTCLHGVTRDKTRSDWWGSPKGTDHSEDRGLDGRMGSEWISVRLSGRRWAGFTWLRIGTVGGLWWTLWRTFGFWRHGVSNKLGAIDFGTKLGSFNKLQQSLNVTLTEVRLPSMAMLRHALLWRAKSWILCC
jgi:hypothetical protein